jgi:two-component system chemotaxis response regulator CheY
VNAKFRIGASTASAGYIALSDSDIPQCVQLLPLNSPVPSNSHSVKLEKSATYRGSGNTALVVDDNIFIRRILAAAFLSSGFETCGEAENGQEGIEVAKQIKPDVITLDLSMPVMNGLQAASELRKLFPNTPIILFTLYADTLSQRDAAKAGVDLVILKTTPVSTLIEKAIELMHN